MSFEFNRCSEWPRLAETSNINMIVLNVSCFNVSFFAGLIFFKKESMSSTSQVCVYRATEGRKLKTPFMKRMTRG